MFGKRDPLAKLVERFVRSFRHLDDLSCHHEEQVPELLDRGIHPGDWGLVRWEPARLKSPRVGLESLRRGGELPKAYEFLVTQYAWLEVDLRELRLFNNPPGQDLEILAKEMFADPVMNDKLLPAGYVRFALSGNSCYDPICFDLNRWGGSDCPIVKFNHENVLGVGRVDNVVTVYASCQAMMEHIVELAAGT